MTVDRQVEMPPCVAQPGSPQLDPGPLELDPHRDDVKFAEPWEARAFAIVVQMADAGVFTWAEWVRVFSAEVAEATAAQARGEPATSYYEQWLRAAEKLMIDKGLTSQAQLAARRFAVGAAGPAHVLK